MSAERFYSTGESARLLKVSQITVKRWIYAGKIRAIKTVAGRYKIPESEVTRLLGAQPIKGNRAVIYARASPGHNVHELIEGQVNRLLNYASMKGYEVVQVLREISSGLNEKRPKLYEALNLLEQKKADIILVEHKDRLTRFGLKYLETLVAKLGGTIEVAEKGIMKEGSHEIIEDTVSITTCLMMMLHGAAGERLKRIRMSVIEALQS